MFQFILDDEIIAKESSTILRALSFHLEKSLMFCENLVCKEMQTTQTGTNKKWKDSFFSEQSGIYDILIDKHENIIDLVLYTDTDMTIQESVKFKKCNTDKLNVHHCIEMSAGLLERKTTRKGINKSNSSRQK